ncbi:MAG: translation initiation factor IF-2 subunit alpha [Nanoarchaeota archaeon]|nr:translation initiation factor IF-2 subunit alpha [Nanoarchaeota archaeon]MBU1269057.1 translation initiation factor IF-2 subunit alpha [Nanoarchaeota archaeon]MBU1604952.1 translation initiation factor IF-2 subunit alpha [Nanoarchaeota archaeon]MBU2443318.1 translation initiation factor IF-2 subunit alpha [Nanoarchaeota archaeon]
MLFKREGYPEEDELVLCTVTKVQPNAVFCDLDEYRHSGMIHISEVSPGRIRNIRDFVREEKKVVCLILKINEERGHIDLSLRRVNESQKRRKLEDIKQEQKAEKIVELLANELKKPLEEVYKQVSKPILEEYDMLHLAFNEVVEHNLVLSKVGLDKKLSENLTKIIKDKIKPKEVMISGDFKITVYDEDGLEIVKTALQNAEKIDEKVNIKYEGGGKYGLKVVAKDYKEAEDILRKAKEEIIQFIEKKEGEVAFQRHEK